MQLSFLQICSAAYGVAYCECADEVIRFHRFTKEQEAMYQKEVPEFRVKLTATAGVSLRFRTDSPTLSLRVHVTSGSTRTYFAHDVLVNGAYIGSLQNFDDAEMKNGYPMTAFPLGDFSKSFSLGNGEKEITVLFPALVSSALVALTLEDGATFSPIEKRGVYLAVGDSITQGYDSTHPRHRYTARIAQQLGLCEHNLAIGGEVFRPSLAERMIKTDTERITIAYGSNDWKKCPFDEAKQNATAFLSTLADTFSDRTVYVFSPIWRSNCEELTAFGAFSAVDTLLREICSAHDTLEYVNGFDFVPHSPEWFGDFSLHPNDEGFAFYAEGIRKACPKFFES